MLYFIIRFFILSIFILLFLQYIRKGRKLPNKILVILIICIIGIFSIILIIPFENLVFSFSSPESAFYYQHSGDICHIINGTNITVVVYKKSEVTSYCILYKDNEKWKISMILSYSIKFIPIGDPIGKYILTIVKFKNSNETCILVDETFADTITGKLEIADNYGSVFSQYSKKSISGAYNITYYTIINYNEIDYTLILDGNNYNITLK